MVAICRVFGGCSSRMLDGNIRLCYGTFMPPKLPKSASGTRLRPNPMAPVVFTAPVSKLTKMEPAIAFLIGSRNRPNFAAYTTRDDHTLLKITSRHFDGYSIVKQSGYWTDPVTRRPIDEDSRMVIIATDDLKALQSWQNEIVIALQQKAIIKLGYWTSFTYTTDLYRLSRMAGAYKKKKPKRII
jgi:hypothetical protein